MTKKPNFLAIARRILALFFFIGITLLFLDFTGTIHGWLGWMAKVQFLPAVLALNAGVIILLVALTLLLGRVYCSVICPLGIMQDLMARLGRIGKKNKYKYSWSPAMKWLRLAVLILFVAALVAGIGVFVALLAPYSSYGRIVSSLVTPVYLWINNLLARWAEHADSYLFYEKDVWLKSIPVLVTAVITFVILFVLAWRNGRTYCNTICPVGTVLGYLAKFSLMRIAIDTEKCNQCGLCSRRCKAACINGKQHTVDYTRCVACMDCIDTCTHGAISYRLRPFGNKTKAAENSNKTAPATEASEPAAVDGSRRNFLSATALLAATAVLKAQEKHVDGGLAAIEDKQIPDRKTRIVPPGAKGHRNLSRHCTSCQLCISACPNGVLRPSMDAETFMQPESSYERGYCRPECTRCSEVCPTGAICRITPADKSAIQIGHAVWVKENCVPLTDGVECGNCARHCPVGAITMVPSVPGKEDSVKIPVVNTERCIGCGACENLCPARPFSAIYVEGHERHRTV